MADYKFFRRDLNQWLVVSQEEWQWEAHFEDGTVLKQFGDDGLFHQFTEIDQNRLAILKMVSHRHPQTYTLLFSDPAMKPIHFYRNTILSAGTSAELRTRLYCFGYEKKIGSKTHKVIMAITPPNGLLITEDPALLM